MPSKNMLPKGQRRRTVKPQYRAARDAARELEASGTVDSTGIETVEGVRSFKAENAAEGVRLDAYLASRLHDTSRARVQLLIENGQVTVDGKTAAGKYKLRAGQAIVVDGEPKPEPLHAIAEDIPVDVVYEDDDLAVVNKPAGMMVHAGAGATDDERNMGTLVNALLHRFQQLSGVGGEVRPGIVHRLDKMTSGLIVVAKNDSTHRKLAEMFADRKLEKTYIALVHGRVQKPTGTIDAPIHRDAVRRTRMTTRRMGGRTAVSHWKVVDRLETPRGAFTMVEVKIETGRTHQIRVHMASIGHAVVGDTLYGAPAMIVKADTGRAAKAQDAVEALKLERNFLHAARLKFAHPQTGKTIELEAEMPAELTEFLSKLKA